MCQGRFDGATFCPKDGSRLETDADAGQLLGGRYRLIRRVGEGAMGVVFEAEHVHIHRKVAVKLLQRRLAENGEAVERMRREAQAMSSLGHPNIVDCSDFGMSDDGQVYLVMEWLEGENLEDRLERGGVDLETALDVAVQACAGLAEAHTQGVVHRDLKPANLFLTRDRVGALRVKILDFGIAKLGADQAQLTSTGVVIGTPNYMAPEQALGEKVDHRADIYALGIILYEMLAGVVPFQGETALAVLHQHTARMAASPSAVAPERGISRELDTITMTCMAKDPLERYQTAAELGAAIERARGASASVSGRGPTLTVRRAPTEAPGGDSRDDLAVLRRSGRARRIAMALGAATVVLIAGIVIVVRATTSEERSSLPDAELVATATDAPTPPIDAMFQSDTAIATVAVDADGIADAALAASLADATAAPMDASSTVIDRRDVIRKVERGFIMEAQVEPTPPVAGRPTTLTIVIVASSLDAAQRIVLTDGRADVQISIEHFARHERVHRATVVLDAQGAAQITFTPRSGKHHVSVQPSFEGRGLARSRFDITAR